MMRPVLSRKLVALFAAASLALAHAPAAAQSASDKETARALMKDGEARRAKGDHQGALQNFKAAHAIMNVPTTGLELGRTQVDLGMLVEARDTLLSVTRLPVVPGESANMAAARDEAQKLADTIEPKIPSLTIKVEGVPAGATAKVTIDGTAILAATIGVPRKHNPGKHEVVVSAGTTEKRESVELIEGEEKTVTIKLANDAPVKEPSEGSEEGGSPGEPETPKPSGTSPLVYVGFGSAAVFALVGSVTGIMAFSRAGSAKEGCDGSRCPSSTHEDIESSRTFGTVSTVSFALAGAGAIVGVIGLLSAPSEKPKTESSALRLQIGPTGFALAGSF